MSDSIETIKNIDLEFFICKICGSKTKLTDFSYKNGNLYTSLHQSSFCEECHKNNKVKCFGNMDCEITYNCVTCSRLTKSKCYSLTFKEFLYSSGEIKNE
jgi:hypothetical protein